MYPTVTTRAHCPGSLLAPTGASRGLEAGQGAVSDESLCRTQPSSPSTPKFCDSESRWVPRVRGAEDDNPHSPRSLNEAFT